MNVEIVERVPGAEQYNAMRMAIGWTQFERETIEKALPNSLFCICALLDGHGVGMARIIGDGGLAYDIRDVIVLPEYQRSGIGSMLMGVIMDYVKRNAVRNTVISLMASKGKEEFYEKCGFIRQPNERYGSGMAIRWKTT